MATSSAPPRKSPNRKNQKRFFKSNDERSGVRMLNDGAQTNWKLTPKQEFERKECLISGISNKSQCHLEHLPNGGEYTLSRN